MQRILNGEYPSLHSLTLWHSAEDNFGFYDNENGRSNVVLDLFRLLVITSLQIDKSEQLFFDPNIARTSAPLYKWIKATIGFKTACPIPGSVFAALTGVGSDMRSGSNASAHDFYGPMGVTDTTNYATPISDKGIDINQLHSEIDMLRNAGGGTSDHLTRSMDNDYSATRPR